MDTEEARRLTEKLYRRLDSRRREIDELDEYHEGKQPLVYASKSWAQQTTGPMAVAGEYGPVTKIWSSPLISSTAMALASAQTMLANSILPATSVPVRCVPDPRIDLDDPVEILRDGERTWGYVTGYDLPLTVADGEMRVDVGVSM